MAFWEETLVTLTQVYFLPGRWAEKKNQTNCHAVIQWRQWGCWAQGKPDCLTASWCCCLGFTLAFKTLSSNFLCRKRPSCALHNPKGSISDTVHPLKTCCRAWIMWSNLTHPKLNGLNAAYTFLLNVFTPLNPKESRALEQECEGTAALLQPN